MTSHDRAQFFTMNIHDGAERNVKFVMFSDKQTTAHKMADQLKSRINQRARGFNSDHLHTAGSVWITDTTTNVMIHYNTSPQKCCAWQEIKVQDNFWNSLNDQKFKKRNKTIRSSVQCH